MLLRPFLIVAAVTLAVSASPPLHATQAKQPLKATAPGTKGDPQWQRKMQLSDGRMFVTDGGMAMDAALAKPETLPEQTLPAASAKFIEQYLSAKLDDEVSLSDLKASADGRTYSSPKGLLLNRTYIDFLRRVLRPANVRLRMGGPMTPIVIVSGGEKVGVLMPVAK